MKDLGDGNVACHVDALSHDTISREAALITAMDNLGAQVLSYFHGRTRDYHEAEELYMDLWHDVYQHFRQKDFQNLRFLFRRAYQLYADHCRRKRKHDPLTYTDVLPDESVPPKPQEAYGSVEENRLKDIFWERFSDIDLSSLEKEAFWLSARYGYTVREIAPMINLSKSKVAKMVAKAKQSCREYLQGQSEEVSQ